jgi:hypothetical protein
MNDLIYYIRYWIYDKSKNLNREQLFNLLKEISTFFNKDMLSHLFYPIEIEEEINHIPICLLNFSRIWMLLSFATKYGHVDATYYLIMICNFYLDTKQEEDEIFALNSWKKYFLNLAVQESSKKNKNNNMQEIFLNEKKDDNNNYDENISVFTFLSILQNVFHSN